MSRQDVNDVIKGMWVVFCCVVAVVAGTILPALIVFNMTRTTLLVPSASAVQLSQLYERDNGLPAGSRDDVTWANCV